MSSAYAGQKLRQKNQRVSNTTCLNAAAEGHLRALLSLGERDRIKIDMKASRPSLFYSRCYSKNLQVLIIVRWRRVDHVFLHRFHIPS